MDLLAYVLLSLFSGLFIGFVMGYLYKKYDHEDTFDW